jgi:uncharacterized membrane protein YcaP (DUF421 family)
MKKEDFIPWDFQRILFGEAPAAFVIETFIRTFLIYAALLLIIKWLGKRMSGQLTINEMAVMLVLGAIVSVPMQVPGSGLAQGVLLLICTLSFQRGISWLGYKSKNFERATMGDTIMLVSNGILELKVMDENHITRQLIFSQLRQNGISSLGEVDRLYLEASGIFSMYPSKDPVPGLSVYPPDDPRLSESQKQADHLTACKNCGHVQHRTEVGACLNCGENQWGKAVGK